MKRKTILFALILAGIQWNGYSQTKEIAWKSHSGNEAYFNARGSADLGAEEPSAVLIRVEKINDTTFIKTFEPPHGRNYKETVIRDIFWMKPVDELLELAPIYYPNVEMVGFESKETSKPLKKSTQDKSNNRKKK